MHRVGGVWDRSEGGDQIYSMYQCRKRDDGLIRRHLVKLFLVAAICLLLADSALGQDDSLKTDRWRGLVINQATPEDTIKALGNPESDKTDRLRVYSINPEWISKKQDEKIFRKLEYKNLDGLERAELCFLNGSLVLMRLDFDKDIEANALSTIFGIPFAPRFAGSFEFLSPADFESNQGKQYPKSYPQHYAMVAVTQNTFINMYVATYVITDDTISEPMRWTAARYTRDTPGIGRRIQIVSRRIENKDGAGSLK